MTVVHTRDQFLKMNVGLVYVYFLCTGLGLASCVPKLA